MLVSVECNYLQCSLVKPAFKDQGQEVHIVDLNSGAVERSFSLTYRRPSVRFDGQVLVCFGARRTPVEVWVLDSDTYWSIPCEDEDAKVGAVVSAGGAELKTSVTLLSPLSQMLVSLSGLTFDFYALHSGARLHRLQSASSGPVELSCSVFYRRRLLVIHRDNSRLQRLAWDGSAWRELGTETQSPGRVLALGFEQRLVCWGQAADGRAALCLADAESGAQHPEALDDVSSAKGTQLHLT